MSLRDPLYHRVAQGSDATSSWFHRAEVVHGRVHLNLYRNKRFAQNVRMSLDEYEAICRDGLEIVTNARLAERGQAA